MKFLAALFVAIQLMLLPAPVAAQNYGGARTVSTETWVEEWDAASQRWVRVADEAVGADARQDMAVVTTHYVNGVLVEQSQSGARYATPLSQPYYPTARSQPAVAQYGPFQVIDGKRAAVTGSTNQMSPRYFDAMLRDHPGLEVLEMIEAPGTSHDIANLQVGRRIREAGLRTHVPNGGSVRSGAVELFLAGVEQTMDEGAQFAVHSWLDNYGRQPQDFPADHPANRLYLDYYVEMGMSETRARDFYAMTNSVPHASALWLDADEMRNWVEPSQSIVPATRAIMREPVLALLHEPLSAPAIAETLQMAAIDVARPNIIYADMSAFSLAQVELTRLDSQVAFP
ncbi:MAG: alpha/beta hydrolase [Pseudomonadota bacterium]